MPLAICGIVYHPVVFLLSADAFFISAPGARDRVSGRAGTRLCVPSHFLRTVIGTAHSPLEHRRGLRRDSSFLLDLAWRHRDRKLALFGVELDLDLYRACLVNMRLYAWEMPYLILRADALVVHLEPGSPNWRFANRWSPPDWQTEMVTPGGETYADWGRKRDLGELPEEEVGQEVPPAVMTGTDELPLFRGLEGE